MPDKIIINGIEYVPKENLDRDKVLFSMNDIFEVIKTIDRGSNGSEIRNFLNDKFLEIAKNKSNG